MSKVELAELIQKARKLIAADNHVPVGDAVSCLKASVEHYSDEPALLTPQSQCIVNMAALTVILAAYEAQGAVVSAACAWADTGIFDDSEVANLCEAVRTYRAALSGREATS